MMRIQESLDLIEGVWQFDGKTYPLLKKLDGHEGWLFALAHIAKHAVHNSDGVLRQSELADHGEPVDEQKLKLQAMKLFVDAARLLALLGVGEKEVVSHLEDWATSEPQSPGS